MKDNQDNNHRGCNGYHYPILRPHTDFDRHQERLQLLVAATVCIGWLIAVIGVVALLDTNGVEAGEIVLGLSLPETMLVRHVLKERSRGGRL